MHEGLSIVLKCVGMMLVNAVGIAPNTINTALVSSSLGSSSLDALQVPLVLSSYLGAIFYVVIYSTTSRISREPREAVHAIMLALVMALPFALLLAALLYALHTPLLELYGVPAAVSEPAQNVFAMLFLVLPLQFLGIALSGILEGFHSFLLLVIVVTVGGGINVAWNYVAFVVLHAEDPYLSLFGGSIGSTVLLVTGFVYLWRRRVQLDISFANFRRITKEEVLQSFADSAFLALKGLGVAANYIVSPILASRLIHDHSAANLAVYSIMTTLVVQIVFLSDGLGIATNSILSRRLGEKNFESWRRLSVLIPVCALVCVGGGAALILWLLEADIIALFTSDAEVASLLHDVWGFGLLLLLPVAAVVGIFEGILLSVGKIKWLALSQLLSTVLLIPVLVIAFVRLDFALLVASQGVCLLLRLLPLPFLVYCRVRHDLQRLSEEQNPLISKII